MNRFDSLGQPTDQLAIALGAHREDCAAAVDQCGVALERVDAVKPTAESAGVVAGDASASARAAKATVKKVLARRQRQKLGAEIRLFIATRRLNCWQCWVDLRRWLRRRWRGFRSGLGRFWTWIYPPWPFRR